MRNVLKFTSFFVTIFSFGDIVDFILNIRSKLKTWKIFANLIEKG